MNDTEMHEAWLRELNKNRGWSQQLAAKPTKLGEPTVSWPTDPNSFYIHCMYHEFFWGPYSNLLEVSFALYRLDQADPMWDYDCWTVYRGDDPKKPIQERRIENLPSANPCHPSRIKPVVFFSIKSPILPVELL